MVTTPAVIVTKLLITPAYEGLPAVQAIEGCVIGVDGGQGMRIGHGGITVEAASNIAIPIDLNSAKNVDFQLFSSALIVSWAD